MNVSIRKIILTSISFLAGCALICGLAFNFFYFSGTTANLLINGKPINFDFTVIEPLLTENGFSMLDGKSTALLALYGDNPDAYETVKWLATLMSNASIVAITFALGCIACAIVSLFANNNVSKILYWVAGSLALVGAVTLLSVGLISSGYLNQALKMLFESKYPNANAQTQTDIANALSTISFNTASFWTTIIVSVFFVVLVLFETLKPLKMAMMSQNQGNVPVTSVPSAPVTVIEPTPIVQQNTPIKAQNEPIKADETPTPAPVQASVPPKKNIENLSEIQKEQAILELLPKYKKLMDEGIITPEEYEKKKNELLWK